MVFSTVYNLNGSSRGFLDKLEDVMPSPSSELDQPSPNQMWIAGICNVCNVMYLYCNVIVCTVM